MRKHIPNTITCLNLISGCIATYWAFQGEYKLALLFIIIGAVFDFFDGMSARLLHVSSPIGKELDSLADDITFGFAPSAIVFCKLQEFYPSWHSSWRHSRRSVLQSSISTNVRQWGSSDFPLLPMHFSGVRLSLVVATGSRRYLMLHGLSLQAFSLVAICWLARSRCLPSSSSHGAGRVMKPSTYSS